MRLRQFSDEVLYCDDKIVKVGRQDIEDLKERAVGNPRSRIRLCAHRGVEDRLHEMLIIHQQGAYVRPHKHLGKTESFHVIEGLVDVVVFNEEGGIREVIEMGDFASGLPFYFRISDADYHTVLIKSDFLVFHETTSGPFKRPETLFAPWAPPESDGNACNEYTDRLVRAVEDQP